MKGNIKSFVSGCIVTAAVVGLVGSASATVGQKTVALDYNDIMISVNGQTIMKCSPKVGQKLCGKAILNSVLDRT